MSSEAGDSDGALYRAAVGAKRAEFYVPKFERFDRPGASKTSWNWPAFFVAFYWFLYRRMYGYWAIYCIAIPIGLSIAGAVLGTLVGGAAGRYLDALVSCGYTFVWLPLFANSLYHQAIKKRISEVCAKVPDRATQIAVLENSPHTSNIAWVVFLFVGIALIGILAAIAIPAYQTYTIRAQVTEGLIISGSLKAAVADKYAADTSWPDNLQALGIQQAPSGKYVTQVSVERGTISVSFGNGANALIAGRVLSLRPTVINGGDVVWTCGYAQGTGDDPESGPAGGNATDVPTQYLPASCRQLQP